MNKLWKDPRWQKKRLEILERDGWKCRICEDSKKTLHVHHCFYNKKFKPWEYPKDCGLITLCEDCHKVEHEERKNAEEDLVSILEYKSFSHADINQLCGLMISEKLTPFNLPG